MTDETQTPAEDQSSDAEMEVSLGEAYDAAMAADESPTTPDRDEKGRFVSKNPDVKDGQDDSEQADDDPDVDDDEADAEDADADADDDEKTADPDEDDDGEDAEEKEPAKVDGPSHLPLAIRQQWGEIPAAAREAINQAHLDMAARLTEAGRLNQGIAPIRDVLAETVAEFPELAKMTPEQLANDTRELARTRVQLIRDPVNTLIAVGRQLGALPQLQQAIVQMDPNLLHQQQAQPNGLQNPPESVNVEEIVQRALSEREVQETIREFSQSKEHWQAVEPELPRFIEAARAIKGEGTPNSGILEAAYDMAIAELGLMAEPKAPVKKPQAKASPKRTESVKKAKSINLSSGGGKPKPLTTEEELGAAYDRAMTR